MNDVIQVDNLDLDPGTEITLDKVLLAGSLNYTLIGRPLLPTSTVKVSFDIWNYLHELRLKLSESCKLIVFFS